MDRERLQASSDIDDACSYTCVFVSGPLGAGKSTVTALLAEAFSARGLPVERISLDMISHELLTTDERLRDVLVEAFGACILSKDGTIDRAALARQAFCDAASVSALNAITHPSILVRASELLEQAIHEGSAVCLIETPLPCAQLERTPGVGSERLIIELERGIIVSVAAPVELRVERAEARGMTSADIRARLDAQPELSAYTTEAAFVIENNGDKDRLEQAVQKLCADIIVQHHNAL